MKIADQSTAREADDGGRTVILRGADERQPTLVITAQEQGKNEILHSAHSCASDGCGCAN